MHSFCPFLAVFREREREREKTDLILLDCLNLCVHIIMLVHVHRGALHCMVVRV